MLTKPTSNLRLNNSSGLFLLFVFALIISCKEDYPAPPLPTASTNIIEPLEGTFRLSSIDTIAWTEEQFPGLDKVPSRNFNLETADSEFFELKSGDSIVGEFKTQAFNWDSLETKPLNFENWPTSDLNFKVQKLGEPKVIKAGSLTINPESSVGVSSLEEEFGIEAAIRGLEKDKDNMLWFAANNSLIKYDGDNLEIYSTEQGVILNGASSIFEDSRGLLWVGDLRSLSAIDRQNNLVYNVVTDIPLTNALEIVEDEKGRLWVVNNQLGITLIDLDNRYVKRFSAEEGLLAPFVVSLFIAPEGTIWTSSPGQGINILDLDKETQTTLRSSNLMGSPGPNLVSMDEAGNYWISTGEGINKLNKNKDSITFISTENINQNFKGITETVLTDGVLWAGNLTGQLFKLDFEKNTYNAYDLKPTDNNVVFDLIFDNNSQLWISMVTGGLYVLDIKGNQPANITPQKGIISQSVWATLQASDGKKWIGTYEGVDIIDLNEKSITHLSTEDGLLDNYNTGFFEDSKNRKWLFENPTGITLIDFNQNKAFHIRDQEFFDGQRVTSVVEMKPNEFIVSTWVGKLFHLDLNTNSLKSVQIGVENLRTNRVTDIIRISDQEIWFSTTDYGIYKLNLSNDILQKISGTNLFDDNSYYSIAMENNHMWVATFQGLVMLDMESLKSYTLATKHGLPANDIYDIVVDGSTIYAGSSRGLVIVNYQKTEANSNYEWTIRTIGRQQGLAYIDFAQNSMSIDEEGRIWAGVNDEALTVIEAEIEENLVPEVQLTGLTINDKNLMLASTNSPILEFETDTIWSSDNLTYELYKDFENDKNLEDKKILFSDIYGPYSLPSDLELAPDRNFLTFNYNAFQFRDQDKIVYTYFLEGIDRNWSQVTSQTQTENYRDLPPGEYTFKVAAKNLYSNWGEPAEFSFTILPPWWQTWWARALFVLLLSILIWSVIVYRSNWLKKENRLLEEKVHVRTKQLQDKIEQLKSTQNQLVQSEKMASLGELTAGIAHEIQNPLNFVNNFSELNKELLHEMREELESGNLDEVKLLANDISENENKILHHGKRADSIVKGMLQHSRINSGERTLTNINVLADEYLRLAYHGLRAKDKSFNATLETDFDENLKKIPVVAQDMGRVILNIINNALFAVKEKQRMNGDSSYVPTVKITTENAIDANKITIKDNGTGIPDSVKDKIFQPFFTTKSAGQGTGLGLSMSYDIIKSHGGELVVESEQGEGTTFTIILPKTKLK